MAKFTDITRGGIRTKVGQRTRLTTHSRGGVIVRWTEHRKKKKKKEKKEVPFIQSRLSSPPNFFYSFFLSFFLAPQYAATPYPPSSTDPGVGYRARECHENERMHPAPRPVDLRVTISLTIVYRRFSSTPFHHLGLDLYIYTCIYIPSIPTRS